MRDMLTRLRAEEGGLGTLEKIGLVAIIIAVVSYIPPARGLIGDAYDALFKQRDANGDITAFSIAARGILITITSLVAFVGTGFLLLYTNVGKRLAFLITGAATFGWMVIGSMLFVVYAPRGIRPSSLEGLNALQMRVPAIALTACWRLVMRLTPAMVITSRLPMSSVRCWRGP